MLRALIACLVLSACASAGPGFRGIAPSVRDADGSRFVIRQNGRIAEVIRTSPEWLPRFADTAHRAALAVQAETGCRPAWVMGDPAMMLVGFACDGERPPAMPRRRASFSCDLWRSYATRSIRLTDLTLECYKK